MMRKLIIILSMLTVYTLANADEVALGGKDLIGLYDGKPYLHVIHNGKSVKVQRVQDPDYQIKGYFSKTGRKCPPFCIKPMEPSPGVTTIAELEIFKFMENEMRDGSGILIDARTPAWHKKGTIPGAKNYPFTLLTSDPNSEEMVKVLEEFGAKPRKKPSVIDQLLIKAGMKDEGLVSGNWDYTEAKKLVLWCNGASCGQSPRAIRGLVKAGYPAQKLFYYRGGMQSWQFWGLTVIEP